jgi:hypothetical protein
MIAALECLSAKNPVAHQNIATIIGVLTRRHYLKLLTREHIGQTCRVKMMESADKEFHF